MAYEKQNFEDGQVLKAEHLNNIEEQLYKLAEEKVDSSQLTSEVETALQNAKESGQFDGEDGKTAYEYAKEGGYTGTEEEFSKKLAQECATKEEVDKLSEEFDNQQIKLDKYESLTLGKHTDGLIYLFKSGSPVGNGVEITGEVVEGDVFGYVDENNTLVLEGLAEENGTYTACYKMADGTLVNIGELAFMVTVTNNLTNCTINNNETETGKGKSYSATISANDGYTLSSVVVTMGGTDISSSAVSDGVISIAEVTGDIVITAVAEESVIEPSYTNLLPLATNADGSEFVGTNGEDGYKYGYRIRASTGEEEALTDEYCTGFMPYENKISAYICIKNVTLRTDNASYNMIVFYDSNYNFSYAISINNFSLTDGVYKYSLSLSINTQAYDLSFFRFCCAEITDQTIVTVNQDIV